MAGKPNNPENHGWIALHRSVLDHWLWEEKPFTRGQAWVTMLMLANHKDQKVLIHGELIECKRGQSVRSLKSWAELFGWGIQKVRTFFKLLEEEQMIIVEGLRKTTRITICNYEIYQNIQHTKNTQITHKKHTDNTQITTNNNDNNETRVVVDTPPSLAKGPLPGPSNKFGRAAKKRGATPTPGEIARRFFAAYRDPSLRGERYRYYADLLGPHLEEFCEYWLEPNKSGTKVRWEMEKCFDLRRRISTWVRRSKSQSSVKAPELNAEELKIAEKIARWFHELDHTGQDYDAFLQQAKRIVHRYGIEKCRHALNVVNTTLGPSKKLFWDALQGEESLRSRVIYPEADKESDFSGVVKDRRNGLYGAKTGLESTNGVKGISLDGLNGIGDPELS